MAAYGSGAVARSIRDECTVMNIDVGGGTSKIAVCAEGKVIDVAAVDVGARLVCLEADGKIVRVEEAGRRYGAGARARSSSRRHAHARSGPSAIAGLMADKLFETMRGGSPGGAGREPSPHRAAEASRTGRADPVLRRRRPNSSTAASRKKFGDLGPLLAAEIRARAEAFCPNIEQSLEGIRATVVGASQYTVQLSGSTIYVAPLDAVPLRNVPVIAPALAARWRDHRSRCVSPARRQAMLKRLDLTAASSRSRCSCRGRARRRSSGSTPSAGAWSTGSKPS